MDMEFSGRAFMKDWQAPGLGRGRDRAGVSQRARPAPTQAQGTPQRLVLQRVLNRARLARPPPPTLVGVTLTRGSVCEQPLCGPTPEGRQPSQNWGNRSFPEGGLGSAPQCPPGRHRLKPPFEVAGEVTDAQRSSTSPEAAAGERQRRDYSPSLCVCEVQPRGPAYTS